MTAPSLEDRVAALARDVGSLKAQPRDRWGKLDILAKAFMPAVLAFLGQWVSRVVSRLDAAAKLREDARGETETLSKFLDAATSRDPLRQRMAMAIVGKALPDYSVQILTVLQSDGADKGIAAAASARLAARTAADFPAISTFTFLDFTVPQNSFRCADEKILKGARIEAWLGGSWSEKPTGRTGVSAVGTIGLFLERYPDGPALTSPQPYEHPSRFIAPEDAKICIRAPETTPGKQLEFTPGDLLRLSVRPDTSKITRRHP